MLGSLLLAWHTRNVHRKVKRYGWTGIRVGRYDDPPCWGYTVGFWESVGAPEVIIFDIQKNSCADLFREIHRQLGTGELVMEDGASWGSDERPAIWRRVHPDRLDEEWLTLARWYKWKRTGSSHVEAFQLVLADRNGAYPWEPDYLEISRSLQPELYLPPPTRH